MLAPDEALDTVVPVARTDCGGATVDVVALVLAVLAARVKPVVLDVGTATAVVVFSWSPNPAVVAGGNDRLRDNFEADESPPREKAGVVVVVVVTAELGKLKPPATFGVLPKLKFIL